MDLSWSDLAEDNVWASSEPGDGHDEIQDTAGTPVGSQLEEHEKVEGTQTVTVPAKGDSSSGSLPESLRPQLQLKSSQAINEKRDLPDFLEDALKNFQGSARTDELPKFTPPNSILDLGTTTRKVINSLGSHRLYTRSTTSIAAKASPIVKTWKFYRPRGRGVGRTVKTQRPATQPRGFQGQETTRTTPLVVKDTDGPGKLNQAFGSLQVDPKNETPTAALSGTGRQLDMSIFETSLPLGPPRAQNISSSTSASSLPSSTEMGTTSPAPAMTQDQDDNDFGPLASPEPGQLI